MPPLPPPPPDPQLRRWGGAGFPGGLHLTLLVAGLRGLVCASARMPHSVFTDGKRAKGFCHRPPTHPFCVCSNCSALKWEIPPNCKAIWDTPPAFQKPKLQERRNKTKKAPAENHTQAQATTAETTHRTPTCSTHPTTSPTTHHSRQHRQHMLVAVENWRKSQDLPPLRPPVTLLSNPPLSPRVSGCRIQLIRRPWPHTMCRSPMLVRIQVQRSFMLCTAHQRITSSWAFLAWIARMHLCASVPVTHAASPFLRYSTFATGGCDGFVHIWNGQARKRLYQVCSTIPPI